MKPCTSVSLASESLLLSHSYEDLLSLVFLVWSLCSGVFKVGLVIKHYYCIMQSLKNIPLLSTSNWYAF